MTGEARRQMQAVHRQEGGEIMSGETDLTQAGFDAIAEAMDRDGSSTAITDRDGNVIQVIE